MKTKMTLKELKQRLNKDALKIFEALGMKTEVFSRNIYSTCPVHGGDNPRGFSFSPRIGVWRCWTHECQCEHSNDVLGLIQAVLSEEGSREVSFKDALVWACETLGCDVPYGGKSTSTTEPPEEEEEQDFYTKAGRFFVKRETHDPEVFCLDCDLKYPSQYFVNRGFEPETMMHFGVGDCVDNSKYLRDRAVIPIHDDSGKNVVGIIARTVKEYRQPKFLFQPTGFDKRFFFYNYHRAFKHIKDNSIPYLYITEGQGEVWRLYEAGVKNAVSIFGKTLSSQQIDKLNRMPVTTIIVLTDDDQAGRESKVAIHRQLQRSHKLIFPALPNKDVGDMSPQKIHETILHNLKGTY